jgi:hypothetical protein
MLPTLGIVSAVVVEERYVIDVRNYKASGKPEKLPLLKT